MISQNNTKKTKKKKRERGLFVWALGYAMKYALRRIGTSDALVPVHTSQYIPYDKVERY